jgi:hypothetical protein
MAAGALLAGFALPMIGYAAYNHEVNGTFAVTSGKVSGTAPHASG